MLPDIFKSKIIQYYKGEKEKGEFFLLHHSKQHARGLRAFENSLCNFLSLMYLA
jgi:hypothetical protein